MSIALPYPEPEPEAQPEPEAVADPLPTFGKPTNLELFYCR